jgi:ABC-type thiamine transport system substrate-binding protein
MKVKRFILSILCVNILLVSSCVDTVKENSFQYLHLYTDLSNSLDATLFDEFAKQTDIHVYVHYASAESILRKIKTEKWESNADGVLLSNALNLIELNDGGFFTKTDELSERDWQCLFINPFIFSSPKDTVQLFTSYGQLFRNENSRVDASLIKSFNQWGNLIPALKKNYPIYSLSKIQGKILHSDSVKGKETKIVQIAPFSYYTDKSKIVFPDQFYKGAIGIIGGIGLIKQSKNRSNAQELYIYCKNSSWRKKLARDIRLFPILSPEENKKRQILFNQTPPNLKAKT